MAKNCVKCGKKAAISLAYGPHVFCKEHFLEFFEKRVRRNIRKNRLIEGREKIVVAYSGGKDSGTTLYLLNKIFSKSNSVEALLVDEGIKGYRDKALDLAEENCREWKVPYRRVSFKEELGFTMADVMKKTGNEKKIGSTCAYCGVLRRQLLNTHAKDMGAGKLATGHNLDDETQSILMNLCEADLERLLRLGPKSPSVRGLAARIKPLWNSPEADVISFAETAGIKFHEKGCCPFKWQAKRNDFRGILNHLEGKYPGTMFGIAKSLKGIKEMAGKKRAVKEIGLCVKCGEPTSQKKCKACEMAERVKGKG